MHAYITFIHSYIHPYIHTLYIYIYTYIHTCISTYIHAHHSLPTHTDISCILIIYFWVPFITSQLYSYSLILLLLLGYIYIEMYIIRITNELLVIYIHTHIRFVSQWRIYIKMNKVLTALNFTF